MILRRGSVLAAFLLCFLAKVCGLLQGNQREGGGGALSSAGSRYMSTVMLTLHVTMPHAKCAHSSPSASCTLSGRKQSVYSVELFFFFSIMGSNVLRCIHCSVFNRCQRDLDNSSCKSYRCTM